MKDIWFTDHTVTRDLIFRIAVREIEAWLLADRKGFSLFSGVPVEKIPYNPESLTDPKQTLMGLIRRLGRREIKANILPERGSGRSIGFGYNEKLCGFVRNSWSVDEAAAHAGSLARAYRSLCELGSRYPGSK